MSIADTMNVLGLRRMIWIDDLFSRTADDLATMVLANQPAARTFPELAEVMEQLPFLDEPQPRVAEAITGMTPRRGQDLLRAIFAAEDAKPQFATSELSGGTVVECCAVLGVADEDCWTFDQSNQLLAEVVGAGDREVGYVIDLNEAGGGPNRGLDVLAELRALNAKGTAFILTHEATAAGEGDKEGRLADTLAAEGAGGTVLPITVIAKERLEPQLPPEEALSIEATTATAAGMSSTLAADMSSTSTTEAAPSALVPLLSMRARIEVALEIGLKRAGLRRSMAAVLDRARGEVAAAFDAAAGQLLRVTPERLERYVFDRGYNEGLSEMHVVERALMARMSERLRRFLALDREVLEGARVLRALRSVDLDHRDVDVGDELADFRKAEVWDDDVVINETFSPLACGDVFEHDRHEDETKKSGRKFILLGQPCDVTLRASGGRAEPMGMLVPLKAQQKPPARMAGAPAVANKAGDEGKAAGGPKAATLDFRIDGEKWNADFRNVTMVKLAILDLASFRRDGRVRVDAEHVAETNLLPGAANVYGNRTATSDALLALPVPAASGDMVHQELILTLSTGDYLDLIRLGVRKAEVKRQKGSPLPDLPERVTWNLRRCGRVRMPHAAFLLERLLQGMGRPAFDLDFGG